MAVNIMSIGALKENLLINSFFIKKKCDKDSKA